MSPEGAQIFYVEKLEDFGGIVKIQCAKWSPSRKAPSNALLRLLRGDK